MPRLIDGMPEQHGEDGRLAQDGERGGRRLEPLTGCPVAHPAIDAVGIDSSSFHQLSDRVYRLNVSVRNTSPHPVAMPALEVILLNDDEQVVVRRVVANDAALPAPPVLTPRGEWNGSVLLQVRLPPEAGRQSIAGYRVAVFYP